MSFALYRVHDGPVVRCEFSNECLKFNNGMPDIKLDLSNSNVHPDRLASFIPNIHAYEQMYRNFSMRACVVIHSNAVLCEFNGFHYVYDTEDKYNSLEESTNNVYPQEDYQKVGVLKTVATQMSYTMGYEPIVFDRTAKKLLVDGQWLKSPIDEFPIYKANPTLNEHMVLNTDKNICGIINIAEGIYKCIEIEEGFITLKGVE